MIHAKNIRYEGNFQAAFEAPPHNTPRMQSRSTPGPTDPTGSLLAGIVAAVLLLLCLTFETQYIAALHGYQTADFGKPMIGYLYAPWKSLEWMQRYDLRFNFALGARGGSGFYADPNEPAWARAAFAAERSRLPWEGGAALLVFLVLGYMWSQRQQTSNLHGGARWATSRDLRRSPLSAAQTGVVLGQTPGGKRLLVHDGSEAVLAIGPPGSGKTNGIATP